jgi:hypothetical protein
VPRLSIIIPCLGGAAEFDGTLVSLLQNRPANCEVLVLHSEPYGDPYGLGHEVRFVRVPHGSLVDLANRGIAEATGEILHFVGCGLEVVEGWTEPALAHFDDPEVAAVSPLVLSSDTHNVIAGGVRFSLGGARRVVSDRRLLSAGTARLRASILGPTLAAAFYRRDVLAALDGFDRNLGDRLADVDIALAIQALGRLHICEPASRLIQTADPWAAIANGGFVQGRTAERLFWRSAAQRGMAASLAMHPFTILADAICANPRASALTSLVGRLASTLEFGAVQRCQRRLSIASERLAELETLRATIKMPARRAAKEASDTTPARRRAA